MTVTFDVRFALTADSPITSVPTMPIVCPIALGNLTEASATISNTAISAKHSTKTG